MTVPAPADPEAAMARLLEGAMITSAKLVSMHMRVFCTVPKGLLLSNRAMLWREGGEERGKEVSKICLDTLLWWW